MAPITKVYYTRWRTEGPISACSSAPARRRCSLGWKRSVRYGYGCSFRRGVAMIDALSIHHAQAGHQFETTVDGHRAYLAYMDLGKQTLDIYRTFVPNV